MNIALEQCDSVPVLRHYIRTLGLLEVEGTAAGYKPGDWLFAVSMLSDLVHQMAAEIYADHVIVAGAAMPRALPGRVERLMKAAMHNAAESGGGAG